MPAKRVVSDKGIAAAAAGAGIPKNQVDEAVAIALAESSGNANALNDVPPDLSYGLWQINMLGDMGPERRRQLKIGSNEALYDPQTNARAAKMISSGGTNWRPWSTYTNGAYTDYLSRGRDAAAGVSGGVLPGGGIGGWNPGAPGGQGLIPDWLWPSNASPDLPGQIDPTNPDNVISKAMDTLLGPIAMMGASFQTIGALVEKMMSPTFWTRVFFGMTAIPFIFGGILFIAWEGMRS